MPEIALRYAGGGSDPAGWAANTNGHPYLTFDDTTVQQARFAGVVPDDYDSGLTATIFYSMASATSGKVDFEISVMCVSPDDAADVDTDSFDSVNDANETVPGTAGYMSELDITLTNADGIAAGDMVFVKVERDADDETDDTATGDAEVRAVRVQYSTA
jgi:hypothetical protein